MALGLVSVKLERGGLVVRITRPSDLRTRSKTGRSVLLTDPKERYAVSDGSSMRVTWCVPNFSAPNPAPAPSVDTSTRFGRVTASLDKRGLVIHVTRPTQPDVKSLSGRSIRLTDPNGWVSLPDGSTLLVEWLARQGWRPGQVISGGRIESNRRRF